jgi:hypothetical protein
MLKTKRVKYYRVKERQTVWEIAEYFSVSPYLLAKRNGLESEPPAGSILEIPMERGNCYVVREGNSKALLCGSAESYTKKNGTDIFYIGMRVIL